MKSETEIAKDTSSTSAVLVETDAKRRGTVDGQTRRKGSMVEFLIGGLGCSRVNDGVTDGIYVPTLSLLTCTAGGREKFPTRALEATFRKARKSSVGICSRRMRTDVCLVARKARVQHSCMDAAPRARNADWRCDWGRGLEWRAERRARASAMLAHL